MKSRFSYGLALFLATAAAFSIGLGHPRAALAADDTADLATIEKLIDTPAGKTALERAGVSADDFKAMLGRLSPEQKKAIAEKIGRMQPKARLAAQMVRAGYTPRQAAERIAVLTDDEIATLTGDPDAMASGGAVGTIFVIVLMVLAAILVSWYFVAIEPEPVPPGADEPPPAK
jgi:hypothetical protein